MKPIGICDKQPGRPELEIRCFSLQGGIERLNLSRYTCPTRNILHGGATSCRSRHVWNCALTVCTSYLLVPRAGRLSSKQATFQSRRVIYHATVPVCVCTRQLSFACTGAFSFAPSDMMLSREMLWRISTSTIEVPWTSATADISGALPQYPRKTRTSIWPPQSLQVCFLDLQRTAPLLACVFFLEIAGERGDKL